MCVYGTYLRLQREHFLSHHQSLLGNPNLLCHCPIQLLKWLYDCQHPKINAAILSQLVHNCNESYKKKERKMFSSIEYVWWRRLVHKIQTCVQNHGFWIKWNARSANLISIGGNWNQKQEYSERLRAFKYILERSWDNVTF